MKEKLQNLVSEALKECFGLENVSFSIEQPKELTNGDYMTNVAFTILQGVTINLNSHVGELSWVTKFKEIYKNPKDVAQKIVEFLNTKKDETISDISVAGPGFINFSLSEKYFNSEIKNIFDQKENWGKSDIYAGKKILVEHSSPNLFKPFHVGHLMNNTIGESLFKLADFSGATATATSFPSDISLGIAKAIYIVLEKNGANFTATNIAELGDAYVEGTKRYDEDESIHVRVKEIADNLYAGKPSDELVIFNICKDFNIAYFESVVARLGSHFDSYIYESESGVVGKKIVLENVPNVFTESEGAVVYIPEESRKDINTFVFINSQGNPTYEAKDIGLIDMKSDRYNPDISIYVTDIQQIPHFKVVLAAAEKINDTWKKQVEAISHIPHGRMTFKGQKMSSRLGGVPLVTDILQTVIEEVEKKNPDIAKSDAEQIGIAALKFSILRAAPGKNIDFDPETSLSFEGDSGPYLQYSTVRAKSILKKTTEDKVSLSIPENWKITNLEKTLIHFREITERSISEWAPHHIVGYLLELARDFNSWYGNTKILDETDPASGYKLAITKAFSVVMTKGLDLLGIHVPEQM